MPTKRALLISNPGESGDENYCRGVYVDVRNYQRFLASPEGGGWSESEIEPPMDRPTKAGLRLKIAELAGYDFTMVMFTGHGWYSSTDHDRILILRKGEEIASLDLCQNARKRIVILDCCQVVHKESLLEKRAHMVCFANAVCETNRSRPDRMLKNLQLCHQRKVNGQRRDGGPLQLFIN